MRALAVSSLCEQGTNTHAAFGATQAREEIEMHRNNLQGWGVLLPILAGPPRLSPQQLAEHLNDAGLRSKELVRLCDLMKGPPREDIDHVAKVCT